MDWVADTRKLGGVQTNKAKRRQVNKHQDIFKSISTYPKVQQDEMSFEEFN